MDEDSDNHGRIFDSGDDLQGAAAVREVVDVEDPLSSLVQRMRGDAACAWT